MGIDGFATPAWFGLLGAVTLIAVGYVLAQRRRKRQAMRFANLELLERVAGRRQGWPKHIPALLFVIAFLVLTVGMAGPTASAKVPRNRAVVMLVIDVSLSMRATDINPTRIASAQASAKSFVQNMPPGINLGLETFGGAATVDVSPVTDRRPVLDAIDNIKLQQATATGDAMAAALQSIQEFERVIPGGPAPARIVLMSDGKQTTGRDEFEVARTCADAKVPVNTISFGTSDGVIDLEGEQVPVPVDDDSLHRVADIAKGQFYKADTSNKLQDIYNNLGEQIGYETKEQDVSKSFFAVGSVLSMIGAGAALLLTQRLP